MITRTFFAAAVVAVLVLLTAPQTGAMELEQGFIDLPWGTEATTLADFKKVGSKGKVDYYVNPRVVHTIGDVEISDEIYGFFNGRFFAVYINIDAIETYAKLKEYLNSKFGEPNISLTMKSKQTIYKWKHQSVKIKLKLRPETGQMKLGFYNKKGAKKVSEAELESYQDTGGVRFLPIERDKRPAMMPLLVF